MFKSGVLLALQVSMLTFSACPRDGPVCIQGLNPTPTVFQLEARPRGGSHRCTQPTLGMGLNYANPPWAILLSQVRMQNANLVLIAPVWKSQAWYPILLALLVDYPCLLPAQETTILQMHTITLPIRGHEVQLAVWPISGDLAKRDSFSKEATSLLMASWRSKSQSSYNSLFHKWECWCNERNRDPIHGPVTDVINFLAEQYEAGYSYRSLNSYRSAISSAHQKVDGHLVEQHPMVARVLKGAFNGRPPKLRYTSTWKVSQVVAWLDQQDNSRAKLLQRFHDFLHNKKHKPWSVNR